MDGGSIGVHLVDSKGQAQSFALQVDAGAERSYSRLFAGATHSTKPGAVEIPFSIDTRRMLILWIDEHRNSADSSDLALLYLRGNVRDYAHVVISGLAKLSQQVFR